MQFGKTKFPYSGGQRLGDIWKCSKSNQIKKQDTLELSDKYSKESTKILFAQNWE